jgi:ubiquinone biosynthesis protein COQ9
MYWLEDRSEDFADTRGFIDRRLADVAGLGKARERLGAAIERLPNPLRLFRPIR